MPSDHFDFVRARAKSCRPISPGLDLDLLHCRQLILKPIEVICENCLNGINNGSAYSVPFLNTTGLFPALGKTLEHSTGNNPVVLKNSTEHAEPLFIVLSFTMDYVFLVRCSDSNCERNGYT